MKVDTRVHDTLGKTDRTHGLAVEGLHLVDSVKAATHLGAAHDIDGAVVLVVDVVGKILCRCLGGGFDLALNLVRHLGRRWRWRSAPRIALSHLHPVIQRPRRLDINLLPGVLHHHRLRVRLAEHEGQQLLHCVFVEIARHLHPWQRARELEALVELFLEAAGSDDAIDDVGIEIRISCIVVRQVFERDFQPVGEARQYEARDCRRDEVSRNAGVIIVD